MTASKGFFVTGTDTGVGKTVVTGGLCMLLRKHGASVGVMKPVATGCERHGKRLVSEDAVFLMEAAENDVPDLVNPVRYESPLAPSEAACLERREVDLAKIESAFRELCARYDRVLVEGIGGLLVPLTKGFFVCDLAKQLGLPLLIVSRAGLGAINHTLLTVEAARRRGIEVRGVILNGFSPEKPPLAELTNPKVIQDLTGLPIVGRIPRMRGVSVKPVRFGSLLQTFEEEVNLDLLT